MNGKERKSREGGKETLITETLTHKKRRSRHVETRGSPAGGSIPPSIRPSIRSLFLLYFSTAKNAKPRD